MKKSGSAGGSPAFKVLLMILAATTLVGLSPALASDWVEDGQDLRLPRNPATTIRTIAPAPQETRDFTVDPAQFARRPSGPVVPIAAAAMGYANAFVKRLARPELEVLSKRDIIVLIDKSGSMDDKDCVPPTDGLRFVSRVGEPAELISRWKWCERELIGFAENAAPALSNGIRVVLFAGDQNSYDHVSINQIPAIFQNNYPEGSTNEAAALKTQFDSYFSAKAAHGGRSRPIVIAVITDGLPNSTTALKRAIIEATASVQRPDEIAITFLQIGNDKKGIRFVHELDDGLMHEGALYDIVDSKDFQELQRVGLAHALVDAINEADASVANRR